MLPDRVSNPGPLTYESGALPIALRGPAGRLGHGGPALISMKWIMVLKRGYNKLIIGPSQQLFKAEWAALSGIATLTFSYMPPFPKGVNS